MLQAFLEMHFVGKSTSKPAVACDLWVIRDRLLVICGLLWQIACAIWAFFYRHIVICVGDLSIFIHILTDCLRSLDQL